MSKKVKVPSNTPSPEMTERKRVEEALKESEAKFKTIVENIRDVVFQLSPLGIIQYVSPKVQEVYGYKPEDLVGKHFKKTTPISELVKALDALKSVLSGKVISNLEVNQLDSKGKIIPMEINLAPMRREGKIIAMQGIMRDITERKRVEEALAKSHDELEIRVQQRTAELAKANEELRNEITERKEAEELYIAMANNPHVGFYIIQDEKYVFLNQRFQERMGYTEDKFSSIDTSSPIHPDDREMVKEKIIKMLKGELHAPFEFRTIVKGGETKVLLQTVTSVQYEGKRAFLGCYMDITERKRMEDRLRESEEKSRVFMETASDLMNIADKDGKLTYVNDSMARTLGYFKEELIGMHITQLLSKESLEKNFKPNWGKFLTNGEISLETTFLTKEGKEIYCEIKAVGVYDSDGNFVGSRAVHRDITERKLMEEELQKTIAELERSNAELERFAYIASHDLQEPLRMVASYTQLLEKRYKDRLDADAHDFIGYAVDGAKRMQQLINDLLTYSRVGTRGKPFEPTDCMTVFEAAIANLDVTIRESGAEVTSDPLPPVMADEGQLVQLLQNLIDNAVKFHGEEPPRVHVSVEQKGDEWVFSVRDNGIGIDSQYLEHAFMVFQRLHSGKYRGTGIGLSIGKRIVERHGGRIWLESQPGKGTIVHFTIPVKGGKQS